MKSEIAKAINYGLSRWEAFTRFLSDGLICLSNNRDERALRGVTPGRANWTFAGSDAGGHRAAAVYTTSVVILLWKWYYMGYYNSARTHLSQGYAAAAACLGHRTHSSDSNSRQITPSLRSDLISDKDRDTAHRIFERLRDEQGFTGGYTIVREHVAQAMLRRPEMLVPLSHRPSLQNQEPVIW